MNIAAYQIVEALLDFDPRRPGSLREDVNEPRDVIYRDRVVKDGSLTCPHCGHEIREKETFSDDDLATTRHRPCGGIIKFRPPSDDVLKTMERAWGVRLNKETNKWELIDSPRAKSDEDSNGEPDDYDEYA